MKVDRRDDIDDGDRTEVNFAARGHESDTQTGDGAHPSGHFRIAWRTSLGRHLLLKTELDVVGMGGGKWGKCDREIGHRMDEDMMMSLGGEVMMLMWKPRQSLSSLLVRWMIH